MLGYGADGNAEEQAGDFNAVRGSFADNSFVKQMQEMLGDRSICNGEHSLRLRLALHVRRCMHGEDQLASLSALIAEFKED